MCGIAGFIAGPKLCRSNLDGLRQRIRTMTAAMPWRGPDDEGHWLDEPVGLALGHRRLAIQDLSAAGHQPMHSACGRWVMVFNGEIYNHLALRERLAREGMAPVWHGHSDSETLLAGVAAWGLATCLKQTVGMFALAVWDRSTRTLHLARDRMGEKPLYWGTVAGGWAFASELKPLRALPGFDCPLDRRALSLYLQHCTVPAPWSVYQGISKLEPGQILSLPVPGGDRVWGQPHIQAYWSLIQVVQQGLTRPITDEAEALHTLHTTLAQAVHSQMLSDVPLGAFLSGGVDSSTVVALMQQASVRPVQTFTIGFDEAGYDESPYAEAVARHLGTEHHCLHLRAQDALEVIPQLPRLYDEPFADSSQIPTHLVCKAARERVTVALSGDGGDELFGGYNRHLMAPRLWNQAAWLPFAARRLAGSALCSVSTGHWNRLLCSMPGKAQRWTLIGEKLHKLGNRLQHTRDFNDLYRSLVSEWPEDTGLLKEQANLPTHPLLHDAELSVRLPPLERMMLWDTLTYLPDDILTKVDRAAMGVSLETRVPLLDHRVVELAWRLPAHLKVRQRQGKWALRQVLYRHVPRELIERPKAGFALPVGQWLRGPLKDWASSLLAAGGPLDSSPLRTEPIRTLWTQHLNGRHEHTVRLWTVLMFLSWLDQT